MNKNVIVSMFIYSNISTAMRLQLVQSFTEEENTLFRIVRTRHLLSGDDRQATVNIPPEVIEYIKNNL